MDTVMPSKQWTMDPFGATIVGNRLYGLGVLDIKASLAVFIYAAKALLEAGITLGGDLLLTFAVDEEPGGASPYGTNYLLDHGLTATTAIVAEPGLSAEEHTAVVRGFARLLYHYLALYLPGPDVCTNDAAMKTIAVENGIDHAIS